MNAQFMEKVNAIVTEAFTLENIKAYLDVNAKFYHLPYYNIALVYNQRPEAKNLAGEYVWKNILNRPIKADAKPILCLYPKKNDNSDELDFDIGTLYDISDTEGPLIDFDEEIDIEDVLRQKGFIINAVNKKDFNSVENFAIDVSEMAIYIDDSLKGEKYIEVLLKSYIDYKFKTSVGPISDAKYKKQIINYVVLTAFGIEVQYAKFIFINKFKENKSIEEICDFLDDIQLMVCEVIEDFMGDFISFEEVNLLNQLMTENKEDLLEITNSNNSSFFNKLLTGRLLDLQELIKEMSEEDYNKLLEDRSDYKLISFPFYYTKRE